MNDEARTGGTTSGRRILVVDDDRDFADTLARLLGLEGYEVRRAYSVEEAQEALDRFPAEVALVDIRMGEVSGLSLVSSLRRERPEVICVIMTAYSSIETAIEALQQGAYDYLRKPFYTGHLLATLDRCFERIALAQARQQAEAALRTRNRELERLNKRLARTESILRQRNRELAALNEQLQNSVRSMRRLAAFSSLRELCAALLEEVSGILSARSGVVYLKEAGELTPIFSIGAGDPQEGLPASAEAPPRPESDDAAEAAFPLVGEAQEPVGLIVLKAGSDRGFSRQDRELGEILVSFAGEAIRLVQALESLAWSEERLRDVIDNSPSSISLKDLDGRFVIVNKRFEEWYGRDQSEVAGKTSRDVFLPEVAQLYMRQWEEVLNSRSVVEEEIQVTFADGKPHSLLVTKFPVLGASGRAVGVGTIATDITDSRRAEEQLRQAQKTEALGQLTGGIAHDFNNLLAVISGNLDLMRDELGDHAGLSELLEDALSSAQSGAELTHRLLAFGRRQTLHPQPVDAGELVVGMSRMLLRTLGETIEIRRRLSDGLWPVEVDRNQLETSVLNLALNARDAMPDGGALTIQTENARLDLPHALTFDTVNPGDYVVVTVMDSGAGMHPEIVESAIEPFFTTKEVGHGSGLGLSMVYGFVKQSGGHLDIASVPGAGSSVRLFLPRAEQGAPAGKPPASAAVAASRSGERILVVEDKAEVRRLAKRILTHLGYQVLEASNGKAALETLASGPEVDLLFTDVVLPGGMSGADLAKAALVRHPKLKVLFTSGYASDTAFEGVLSGDEIRFIKKPFAREGLARMVRHALESSSRERETTGA